ncbi:hypothetical protein ACH5RR_009153 [Cinchona calisaya]|uniref:Uncharacterized protein n=1 Tax=Cinchona calisaya TaxID=153742 RepID=A0ABD3ADC8_9GENT
MPMRWLSSESFDFSMSRESVEALGNLFKVACMEQNLSHNILPKSSVGNAEQGQSSKVMLWKKPMSVFLVSQFQVLGWKRSNVVYLFLVILGTRSWYQKSFLSRAFDMVTASGTKPLNFGLEYILDIMGSDNPQGHSSEAIIKNFQESYSLPSGATIRLAFDKDKVGCCGGNFGVVGKLSYLIHHDETVEDGIDHDLILCVGIGV